MTREEIVNSREYNITKAAIEYYNKNLDADSITAFEEGVEWADKHPHGSVIKWQTGEPKTHGRYLIQTDKDGLQIAFWSAYVQSWSLYHNSEIIAWCKLSDIEPYKEETKDINCVDCAHLYGYNNKPVCSYFNEVNPFVTARCREAFKRRREGMKIEKAKIRNGRLQCHVCVHWKNCNEVNTECVANFIHNNIVVHLVEKERKEQQP